ncbi:hypothetical protein E5288_WYG020271 [Bos mutus]|uniref:Uncharacterized protein n=1 Tax=Bos mutus TaxID=72004 RepID=A0A6B0S744_9CETA|nr:hypothetical protein [Bos mutus]
MACWVCVQGSWAGFVAEAAAQRPRLPQEDASPRSCIEVDCKRLESSSSAQGKPIPGPRGLQRPKFNSQQLKKANHDFGASLQLVFTSEERGDCPQRRRLASGRMFPSGTALEEERITDDMINVMLKQQKQEECSERKESPLRISHGQGGSDSLVSSPHCG